MVEVRQMRLQGKAKVAIEETRAVQAHTERRGSNLKCHVKLHKPDEEAEWFYCFNCEHRTKSKNNLKYHMLLKHTAPEAVQWFTCDKCQCKFKTKSHLNRHQKNLHSSKEVQL
ncbi:hypothetical protein GEV33_002449 [Tenebrio molitor]|uniref:C2H2-type domain-containing protein n=1 Tax=Tenebrio molitor TaxID=7067 RepID=A0A8J6LIT3_TENMO|nr:hypothetical protein GEV33_002449 [Tenebrio molitor]